MLNDNIDNVYLLKVLRSEFLVELKLFLLCSKIKVKCSINSVFKETPCCVS